MEMTRRQLLKSAGAGAALAMLTPLRALASAKTGYELPPLPYAYDALEPYIDAETMKLHHDFHHKAYVDNLNKALKDHPELAQKPVDELLREINSVPESIRQQVINQGGGHANHSMFWQIMGPKAGGQPSGALAKAIDEVFGGFDKFQQNVSQKAISRFGSGWSWLVVNNGKMEVTSTGNQDSPYMANKTPLLGLDVWEHAYYLKYKNRRPDYVKAWWNVVNWDTVAERYERAAK
jgi:Fe-Mn family superoxide dismutase